ncbi:hypothetical protein RIR_jg40372.t1 [Rhizophagus irregularis DAOM 181602=DAOM 197198]|nr:hypothetical protein RIR_jg40372.t1 [Rhizophagus irregularis DAOM 181602=DAOM 197198]
MTSVYLNNIMDLSDIKMRRKSKIQNQTNDKNLLENKTTKLAFGSDVVNINIILSNFYYSLKMRVTSPMISSTRFLARSSTSSMHEAGTGASLGETTDAIRTKPNNQVITIIEFSSSGKASSTKENDNHVNCYGSLNLSFSQSREIPFLEPEELA